MEWKELQTLVKRKIGYGIVQPGPSVQRGVPIIKVNNIISGLYDTEYLDKTTVENDAKYQRTKLKGGELIVTVVGTCGKTAIVPPHFAGCNLVRATCLIDIEDETICRWIKYYIDSPQGQAYINRNLNTTVQATLNVKNLNEMPIPFYSKEYTSNVVKILSSLDRKIELNNKINADLEEMAQAIFKNWFVDFEPFKDGKFVDSELGMIPEGWKVVVFDNILKVTTTKTGKEGIPEYSVTNTGIHPRDEKFTKNLSKSSAKNKLIRKGNLVFGMSREILNWGIMKEEVGGVSSAYNVYIVDEKIVSTTYLECFIAQRMDYFADLIKPASREGQGVDKALLMKKIICIPPSEVLDVFLEKYNSIMHLTEIRNQENSRLSTLRDTLLPRLMSGELEVPE